MANKDNQSKQYRMGLSRNTFVYRRDKLLQKLRSDLKDYI